MRLASYRKRAAGAALAMAALCGCSSALASQTYALDLSGEMYFPTFTASWGGTLTVVIDASGDGTYGEDDVTFVSLGSNWTSFAAPPEEDITQGAVVVSGGRIVSFTADVFPVMTDPGGELHFAGLGVSYYHEGIHTMGPWGGSATLTPAATVPEPTAAVTLPGGLALVAACAALRRRSGARRDPARRAGAYAAGCGGRT